MGDVVVADHDAAGVAERLHRAVDDVVLNPQRHSVAD